MAPNGVWEDDMGMDAVKGGRETYGKKIGTHGVTVKE